MASIGNQLTWWWESSHKKNHHAFEFLTLSAVILTVFWFLRTLIKSRKEIGSFPPGPRGLPIVGYLPFLGTNLHRTFTELANSYGPIYKFWLGNKLCIVMNSATLAKELFHQDTIFANRDPPIAALTVTYGGMDIAWSSYGSYWRSIRKLLVREMLSNSSLEACYDLRKNEVRKTIREIYTKIGTPLDIGEISFITELEVVSSMLWGSIVNPEKKSNIRAEFQEVTRKIVEMLGKPNISDFFPILARFDIQGVERKTKRLFQRVDKIIDSIIDERVKLNNGTIDGGIKDAGKKDFLQILLELKEKEDDGNPITMTQIKALLLDIMVGGTDTTATMAEFVMAEIIKNKEVMNKVEEELSVVVGMNKMVEESHLPKLHYLDAVMKETFRLHPALPLLVPRCPSQSSIVSGYTIPKGARVFLNVWAIQRDPQVWDNPLEFNPERFLSGTRNWNYSGNNFEYLPFGFGRRICAGIPLAELMLKYLLASFLHSFKWHLPEGDEEVDVSERFGIVIKKKTPLIAIPTLRLSNMDLYKW